MTKETPEQFGSADLYIEMSGRIEAMHNSMRSEMRRQRLLLAKPEKLSAPVYESLSREMIHEDYDRGEPLENFIGNIRKIAARAPKDCPVFVKYDREGDYEGGHYYFLEIGCERPPTPEEVEARKARNAEIREVQAEAEEDRERREREEFERLSAKFASADAPAQHIEQPASVSPQSDG